MLARLRIRLGTGFVWAGLVFSISTGAQTLAHRKPSAGTPIGSTEARGGPSSIPPGAEGEYRWGESGEVVELYEEDGRLRGYLTRRSERREAGSTPITFAFATASADDQGLNFSTRAIHGDFYSFRGRLVRGAAATPRQDGYYLLAGTLTMHQGSARADDRLVGEPAPGLSNGGNGVAREVRLPRTADSHPAR